MALLQRLAAYLQDPQKVADFQRLCGVEAPAGWPASPPLAGESGEPGPLANGSCPAMDGGGGGDGGPRARGGEKRHPSGLGNGAVPGGAGGEAPSQPQGKPTWWLRQPRRNSLTGEGACQEIAIRNSVLYYLFSLGTELGNELFYILFFPFCIWNLDAWVGRRLIIAWVWVMYLGQCTKDVIRWPRPASPPVVKLEVFYNSEYSMPSTHAMSGTAIPLVLVLLSYGRWQYPLVYGLILAICWCSLVCFSRIYMGMHSILIPTNFGCSLLTAAMDKIEEQFANLSIAKRALTEDPTYLLDIDVSKSVQAESNHLVAVSCSNKSIRVYNRETLHLLREYSGHPGLLNGVRFAHTSDNTLFSACSDGTIKCWDTRLATQETVQLFSGYQSNVFISFDINCSDLIVCAGTEKVEEDTFMVFWDARNNTNYACTAKEPLGTYSETHNDDITKICFHPFKPNLVASGSTDGLVNVFDINKENEDDALLATCNSDSSVSFIGWCGKEYKQVYCMTHTEGFCWWDLSQIETEEPMTVLQILDVREVVCIENSDLHYLIGGLYHEKADKLFIVGGTAMGNIHLMNCGIDGLSLVGTLHGGHSATVRSFYWNMTDDSLLTGGEDAQLLLWKPGAVERSLVKKTSMKIASSVHQRVRVHSNSLKSKKQ